MQLRATVVLNLFKRYQKHYRLEPKNKVDKLEMNTDLKTF